MIGTTNSTFNQQGRVMAKKPAAKKKMSGKMKSTEMMDDGEKKPDGKKGMLPFAMGKKKMPGGKKKK